MELKDLNTCDWVVLRKGTEMMVVKDVNTAPRGHQDVALLGREGFCIGANYTKNLQNERDYNCDIMEVWSYDGEISGATFKFNKYLYKKVWQRTEPKELTMEELTKELGYEVKIVEKH